MQLSFPLFCLAICRPLSAAVRVEGPATAQAGDVVRVRVLADTAGQATAVGACWAASVLKHAADAGLDIATQWHSKGSGTFGLVSAANEVRPFGVLLMLLNRHMAGASRSHARSASEEIEVLAGRTDRQYAVMVINKSPRQIPVHLTLLNGPVPTTDPLSRNVTSYEISDAHRSYQEGRVRFFEEHPAYCGEAASKPPLPPRERAGVRV